MIEIILVLTLLGVMACTLLSFLLLRSVTKWRDDLDDQTTFYVENLAFISRRLVDLERARTELQNRIFTQ